MQNYESIVLRRCTQCPRLVKTIITSLMGRDDVIKVIFIASFRPVYIYAPSRGGWL